jgi:hypothetical protein
MIDGRFSRAPLPADSSLSLSGAPLDARLPLALLEAVKAIDTPEAELDAELVHARDRARDLCQDLNATRELDQEIRRGIIHQNIRRAFGKNSIEHCLHRRRIANIAAMRGNISAGNLRA